MALVVLSRGVNVGGLENILGILPAAVTLYAVR